MKPTILFLMLAAVAPAAAQTPTQTQQAQRPQRTEAEARAAVERNRAERARLRKQTGQPVELVSSYMKAVVVPVPEWLEVDRSFYKKYVDALGIPVLASERVPDDALVVARDIINTMLAARPDLRKSMVERKWRTGVIAETEMTMDIPEYGRLKRPGAPQDEPVNQLDRDYHANRSRGLGGNPTTGAEENLLGYPGTRYWGEHIFVHEFAHAIMTAIRNVDPAMHAEIRAAYDSAMAAGKYVHPDGRRHYATTNAGEYWAEGTQWWFFSNYGECFKGHVLVETPEEFKAYDPKLFELLGRVYHTHRIQLDVFHGRRIRPVRCAPVDSALLGNPDDPRWQESAPAVYRARFETSKGPFTIEVTREWAPLAADRFYNLVRHGYYNDARFHRVLPNYIVQWGIHGDPAMNRIWQSRFIPDDTVKGSNTRGTIGFAMTGPNRRAVQVYINLSDNSRNDAQGFAVFGRVVDGMEVVDQLYSGYGANSGDGVRQGRQGPLLEGGNAFMDREFPRLDRIIGARILE